MSMCTQSTYTQSRPLNSHHRYISKRTQHTYSYMCICIYIHTHICWTHMYISTLILNKYTHRPPLTLNIHMPLLQLYTYTHTTWAWTQTCATNIPLIRTHYTHIDIGSWGTQLFYEQFPKDPHAIHSPKIHILQISEHTHNLHHLLHSHNCQNT